jgi:hypothetical protein
VQEHRSTETLDITSVPSRNLWLGHRVFYGCLIAEALYADSSTFALATASLSPAGFVPVEPRAAEVELFRPRRAAAPVRRRSRMSASSRGAQCARPSVHVHYGNTSGGADRFGIPEATPRPLTIPHYAPLLNLSTVYTPQAIIDREDDFVGSDRRSIGQNLGAAHTLGAEVDRSFNLNRGIG